MLVIKNFVVRFFGQRVDLPGSEIPISSSDSQALSVAALCLRTKKVNSIILEESFQ